MAVKKNHNIQRQKNDLTPLCTIPKVELVAWKAERCVRRLGSRMKNALF